MRRNIAIFAMLSLVTSALVADAANAAEPASAPAADQPASPVPDGTKIGKSRPNIQNNRKAAAPVKQPDATAEPEQIQKSKTKSNQSND